MSYDRDKMMLAAAIVATIVFMHFFMLFAAREVAFPTRLGGGHSSIVVR